MKTTGIFVSTLYGAGGCKHGGWDTIYGVVTQAGPKAYTVVWESGLKNRLRQDYPGVKMTQDVDPTALARFGKLGLL